MCAIRRVQKLLRRNASRLFLASFWIFGICSGAFIIFRHESIPFMDLPQIATNPAPLLRLMAIALLPFLLSVIAVCFSSPFCLLMLTFLDGLVYGAVSFLLIRSFPGGWLIRCLLCFNALTTAPVTYYFRLRHISGPVSASLPEILLLLSLFFLLCSIDHSYISPLLAKVFQQKG